jgi:hypothetical protein
MRANRCRLGEKHSSSCNLCPWRPEIPMRQSYQIGTGINRKNNSIPVQNLLMLWIPGGFRWKTRPFMGPGAGLETAREQCIAQAAIR